MCDPTDHLRPAGPTTWEEAVRWLRSQPSMARVVRESYLGEDVLAESMRFASGAEFAAMARVLGLYDTSARLRILDLGAGNGIASGALARLGHSVVALDPDLSESVGLKAAVRLRPEGTGGCLHGCAGVAESLPFRDGMFDVVYARQTLHHVRCLAEGLAACRRVLRPGGRMLAVREHVADDEEQLRAFLDAHPLHRLYGGEHAYRLDEYLNAARSAGLDVLEVMGPFDTAINYYPQSADQVRDRAVTFLARKTGRLMARALMALPPFARWYTYRMSRFDRTPGRLYSFLMKRPEQGR